MHIYICIYIYASTRRQLRLRRGGAARHNTSAARSTAASGTDAVLEIVQLIIMCVLSTVREIRPNKTIDKKPFPACHQLRPQEALSFAVRHALAAQATKRNARHGASNANSTCFRQCVFL